MEARAVGTRDAARRGGGRSFRAVDDHIFRSRSPASHRSSECRSRLRARQCQVVDRLEPLERDHHGAVLLEIEEHPAEDRLKLA